MRRAGFLLLAAVLMTGSLAQAQSAPIRLYAAGSLREAFGEVARKFEAETGRKVVLTFGASGLLRERIEKGEPAQVFASADTDHPLRLSRGGGWQSPVVFTRNVMCALTQSALNARPETLLETMLRPTVRVGTSTPKADPSGDYAWALFRRADAVKPGAFAALDAKALKLTGGPDSPKPPEGRNTYAWVMEQGQADLFLTYCTGALATQRELPKLKVVQMPPELQVGASYGITVREGADPAAARLAHYIASEPGQAVLQRHGFGAP